MDKKNLDDLNHAQRERLAFIEFRLWFLGDVRRPDLIDRFGIAPAVATRDLTAYRELAPENIDFDGRRKLYVPKPSFSPLFEHDPRCQKVLVRELVKPQKDFCSAKRHLD